jgi:sarcosine oxidase
MPSFDVAVVGLGAMGSATLYALARQGVRAIGIERFEPAHSRSSSFGETRVIRLAYFEDPSYVPLLRGAFRAWRDLEARTGTTILTITGMIEAGCKGAQVVEGSLRAAQEHGLAHEVLSPRQVNQRFPAFNLPQDWSCVFQPEAGALRPEKAIGVQIAAAREFGASIRLCTRVREVRPVQDRVEVNLDDGTVIEAGSAVISVGSWVGDIVPALGTVMRLTRQPLMWFEPRERNLVQPQRMPVFFFQSERALTYGLPDICGTGVKAASHMSEGDIRFPDEPRAEVTEGEKAKLRSILERYLPAAAGKVVRTSVCAYTRSPDEHFVLGLHPEAAQIVLASPCSGHGFKFSSLFGEILADLATRQTTHWPIELFKPERFMFRS